MSRIVLTFKNNSKEKEIEKFLETKLSPSGYIKELVWEVMNRNNLEIPSNPKVTNESEQTKDPAEGFNFNLEE